MSNSHVKFIDIDDEVMLPHEIMVDSTKKFEAAKLVDGTLTDDNIVAQYLEDKKEGIKKYVLSKPLIELIKLCQRDDVSGLTELFDFCVHHIMKQLVKLGEMEIVAMSPNVLYSLLSRDDYEKTSFNLENLLCRIMLFWFEHKESTDDFFLKCWGCIRKQLLTVKVLTEVVGIRYYDHLKSSMASELVELYTNNFKGVNKTDKQRYETSAVNKEKNALLTLDDIKKLKPGDKIDAKDSQHVWYVATVKLAGSLSIDVSFSGWDSKYDEQISFFSGRIAKFGSMTNGIEHSITPFCKCKKCELELQKNGNIKVQELVTPLSNGDSLGYFMAYLSKLANDAK